MTQTAIYIAGPYTGEVGANVQNAMRAFHDLADMGFYPFCPHIDFLLEVQRSRPYEFWIEQCLHWVAKCDAVYRLAGNSPGADREVKRAEELGIPVFHTVQQLLHWRDPNGWNL